MVPEGPRAACRAGTAVLAQSPVGTLLPLTLTPASPEAGCCLVLRQELGRDLCGWHN